MEEIKEIKVWKTSDGRLFENRIEAIKQQKEINLKKDLTLSFSSMQDFIENEEFVKFIIENRIELRYILNKHIAIS